MPFYNEHPTRRKCYLPTEFLSPADIEADMVRIQPLRMHAKIILQWGELCNRNILREECHHRPGGGKLKRVSASVVVSKFALTSISSP